MKTPRELAITSLVRDYKESLFSENEEDRERINAEINSLEVEDHILFVMELDEMEQREYLHVVGMHGPQLVADGDTEVPWDATVPPTGILIPWWVMGALTAWGLVSLAVWVLWKVLS